LKIGEFTSKSLVAPFSLTMVGVCFLLYPVQGNLSSVQQAATTFVLRIGAIGLSKYWS